MKKSLCGLCLVLLVSLVGTQPLLAEYPYTSEYGYRAQIAFAPFNEINGIMRTSYGHEMELGNRRPHVLHQRRGREDTISAFTLSSPTDSERNGKHLVWRIISAILAGFAGIGNMLSISCSLAVIVCVVSVVKIRLSKKKYFENFND
jgi:hypothetical protein